MIFTLHLGSRLSTDQVPRQSKVPLSHVAFAHFPLLLRFSLSLSLSTSSHAPPVYHHDFSATFFLHTIHTVSPPFCTKPLFSHSPLHPRISPPNFPIMLIFRRFNRCRFSLPPHTTPFSDFTHPHTHTQPSKDLFACICANDCERTEKLPPTHKHTKRKGVAFVHTFLSRAHLA